MSNLAEIEAFRAEPKKLSSTSLIRDAIRDNLAGVAAKKTLTGYARDLEHFAHFLESSEQVDLYTAKRKHVSRFMNHLKEQGGSTPHETRRDCSWCRERGYPDGRDGCGWSATRRKGSLSAIRFLYNHFTLDEDLPDIDPSQRIPSPRVTNEKQWAPDANGVKKIHATPADPRTRLIIYWLYYAPSRRQTFVDTRWEHIDLDAGTWHLVGKGGKPDEFDLHPRLVKEFKRYLDWLLREADNNPKIADAMEFDESAYVLLSNKGKRLHPSSVTKIVKRHGLKAGVGVVSRKRSREYPTGKTSKLTPHALRRAWARIALNDREVPIDVVSEVLRHEDIATTRKHYAQTKGSRASKALLDMSLD